jgi:hypothetical protein
VRPKHAHNQSVSGEFPARKEQGIFAPEQGIFSREQGISNHGAGNSESVGAAAGWSRMSLVSWRERRRKISSGDKYLLRRTGEICQKLLAAKCAPGAVSRRAFVFQGTGIVAQKAS